MLKRINKSQVVFLGLLMVIAAGLGGTYIWRKLESPPPPPPAIRRVE